jgi:DNA-binding SARP family transcriptional activator
MPARRLPTVVDDRLHPIAPEGAAPIALDSPAWEAWLDDPANPSLSYHTEHGPVTVRRERKGAGWYWYAYRARHGRLRKAYIGTSAAMTAGRLREVAHELTADPAEPEVRIALLGTPAVERDGRPIQAPAKAHALLADLAAHDTPQLRERLLALLWPESGPDAARKNLRNLLWRLRHDLRDDVVQGDERLALADTAAVDVRAFSRAARELGGAQAHPEATLRAARTMARLYRGALLDGLSLADAPDFELWLTTTREQLHELHLRALHQIVAAERAAGRWPQVLTAARAALAHDPLQEPMYRALIEAHAREGDRAAALRQYALLQEMLERELGVAPLPETELLREAVLHGELQGPALPRERAVGQQAAGAHSAPAAPPQPFIGRDVEQAALDAAWTQARSGRAQATLLLGEAGIGKSQLWRVWAERVAREATLLTTQCLAVTEHLPFAPLVDLLHAEPVRRRLAALAHPAPPGWLADIARLTPDIVDLLPAVARPTPLAPAEEQQRVFEALVRSIGAAPGSPTLLFVDDLHWADRATLDWLGYLLHRARDTPLLLVGACRPDELPAPLEALMSQWSRAGVLHRVPLRRLSRAETADLVGALAGDIAHADDLYERSAGNPLFVLELLRAGPGELPAALSDLIQQRLVRLSDVSRQVLQAAAVLQTDITFDALAETSGRGDAETLDALDALLGAGLLAEGEGGYRFSHPLIAAAVERGVSGARRAILHRRAAAAVEQLHAGRLSEVAGRLAAHHQEAGDRRQVARFAEMAGDRALALAAPAEAAYFYELALSLASAPSRRYGLALARYQQGDLDAAREEFAAAADAFAAAGDMRGAARACLERARSHLASSQNEAVVAWVQRGRAYLAHDPDPAAQALAAYLLGAELRAVGADLGAAVAQLEEAAQLAAHEAAGALIPGILLELGNARAQQGDLVGAIAEYRALVTAARARGDAVGEAIGHNNIAYHALLAGDIATAHAEVAAGLEMAEQQGLPVALQWLLSTRGEIALAEGDWSGAEEWLRRAAREAERFGNTAHAIGIRAKLALAARDRGEGDAALRELEAARAEAAQLADPFLQTQLDLALAESYLLRGDRGSAGDALRVAEDRLGYTPYDGLRAEAARLRAAIREVP